MSGVCGAWRRGPARVLFALAGGVALASAALAALVSPWFLLMTAAAGANQLLFSAVGACPASLLIGRACAAGAGEGR